MLEQGRNYKDKMEAWLYVTYTSIILLVLTVISLIFIKL
jgi:hypothetical protein